MPPRLVRRQPLAERLKAYLNPLDFLLWVSEELESSDWDQCQNDWATPLGLTLNFVMLVARANSGGRAPKGADDVFGEDTGGVGWLGWFVRAHSMALKIYGFLED